MSSMKLLRDVDALKSTIREIEERVAQLEKTSESNDRALKGLQQDLGADQCFEEEPIEVPERPSILEEKTNPRLGETRA